MQELLHLLGMPVLQARGEAEALCAELDRKRHVDFCVTADSDAFLFGAQRVIKHLHMDFKRNPVVESYAAEDVQRTLGLGRHHLVALAMLVGCDYSPGVHGVGIRHATRLVRSFPEHAVLDKLRAWGRGEVPSEPEMWQAEQSSRAAGVMGDTEEEEEEEDGLEGEEEEIMREPHCSVCGHPGGKRLHAQEGCTVCSADDGCGGGRGGGCVARRKGFRCPCVWHMQVRRVKEQATQGRWWQRLCKAMAGTAGFPDERIVATFLDEHSHFAGKMRALEQISFSKHDKDQGLTCEPLTGKGDVRDALKWEAPDLCGLEAFLAHHLSFSGLYTRHALLPLATHWFLSSLAADRSRAQSGALYGQYRPLAIKRYKVEAGEQLFLLQWRSCISRDARPAAGPQDDEVAVGSTAVACGRRACPRESEPELREDVGPASQSQNNLDLELETVENVALLRNACPDIVSAFLLDEARKEEDKAQGSARKRRGPLEVRLPSAHDGLKQLRISTLFAAAKVRKAGEVKRGLGGAFEAAASCANVGVPVDRMQPAGQWRSCLSLGEEQTVERHRLGGLYSALQRILDNSMAALDRSEQVLAAYDVH
eukprot:SM000142S00539  [mRNA]  locus=s142:302399:305406:+ [translate_table: standard]